MTEQPMTPRVKNFYLMRKLTEVELPALSLLKPIDLANFDPMIKVATTPKEMALWQYWRCALSSEGQTGRAFTQGRYICCFLFDKVSGGLLGVFAVGDAPMQYPFLEKHLGWEEKNDLSKTNRKYNATKWAKLNSILYVHRCLPVYEFGQLTGGKLMTLMATSYEFVRMLELKYSYSYALFLIRTLHGKASQYNRLHDRKIVFIGDDPDHRGLYWMELRKKAIRYLKGDSPVLGRWNGFHLKDQVDYWKDRWGLPRAERQGITTLTFDKTPYQVSHFFDRTEASQPLQAFNEEESTPNPMQGETE